MQENLQKISEDKKLEQSSQPLRDIINTNWNHLNESNNHTHVVGSEVLPSENNNQKDLELKSKKSIFFYFFIFSIIILLLAGVYVFYQYYFDKNSISTDKIDVNIAIDNTVPSGQGGLMNISIVNNNKLTITNSRLELSYQKGVGRSGVIETVNKTFSFNNIQNGIFTATSSDYIFIGNEGDTKNIKATLYYKVPDSNAEYYKVTEKKITISKPSVLLDIKNKKTVIEDNETTVKFSIKNLSLENTTTLNLKIETPAGFVVEKKDQETNPLEVNLKDIKKGDTFDYNITGYFKNRLSKDKVFKAYIVGSDSNSVYVSTQKEIVSIDSPINIGGSAKMSNQIVSEYILDEQKEKELYLTFKNTSSDIVTDLAVFIDINTGEKLTFKKDNSEVLDSINPNEEKSLSAYIKNVIAPNTVFNIEVYGKMRGDFDSILLKRQVINIATK